MESIEFVKTPKGFRYLDLEDFKTQLTDEVQNMLLTRQEIMRKHNASLEKLTLPITAVLLFEDFTALRCDYFPESEKEKILGLQAIKKVAQSPEHDVKVTHVLIIMEAWMGSYQISSEDRAKYTEEELQRRAAKHFRADEEEKTSTVVFILSSPALKEVNGKTVNTTQSEITIYKLVDDTFLEHHMTNTHNSEETELNTSAHFQFFNDLTDEELEQNKKHGLKLFNALDAINEIRSTLLSISTGK